MKSNVLSDMTNNCYFFNSIFTFEIDVQYEINAYNKLLSITESISSFKFSNSLESWFLFYRSSFSKQLSSNLKFSAIYNKPIYFYISSLLSLISMTVHNFEKHYFNSLKFYLNILLNFYKTITLIIFIVILYFYFLVATMQSHIVMVFKSKLFITNNLIIFYLFFWSTIMNKTLLLIIFNK